MTFINIWSTPDNIKFDGEYDIWSTPDINECSFKKISGVLQIMYLELTFSRAAYRLCDLKILAGHHINQATDKTHKHPAPNLDNQQHQVGEKLLISTTF